MDKVMDRMNKAKEINIQKKIATERGAPEVIK